MRDGWQRRWGWRVSAVVLVGGLLVLGTGNVVTQAGERDDDHNHRNPFQRILDKLDKILDAIKDGGGQEGNHTLRWDQILPAAQRFVVLAAFNNAAVLDRETGLVWEKTPDRGEFNWFSARATCVDKTVGGRIGWRLPSYPELASLLDPSVPLPGPKLPPGHPFSNVQPASYWSATTNAEVTSAAWFVDFAAVFVLVAAVEKVGANSVSALAWCVRSPMQESVY
jgi:Protein of unknown function (DUF1566)